MRDWRKANLDARHWAMLEFAEKLTVNPGGVTRDDMQAVLDAGFTERQYYDIVLIAAQFNFMDRIADALGVELDKPFEQLLAVAGEAPVFSRPDEE